MNVNSRTNPFDPLAEMYKEKREIIYKLEERIDEIVRVCSELTLTQKKDWDHSQGQFLYALAKEGQALSWLKKEIENEFI